MMEKSTKGYSLDIHIRFIQKDRFFVVPNILPTNTIQGRKIYDGDKYSPVIYIKREKNVDIVSPQPQTQQSTSTTSNTPVEPVKIVGE